MGSDLLQFAALPHGDFVHIVHFVYFVHMWKSDKFTA